MPSIQLTDEQVADLYEHLSPARQAGVLQALVRSALVARETITGEDINVVNDWCARRNLDWNKMTDAERSWRCLECFADGGLASDRSGEDDFEIIINESLRTMKETQV